MAGIGRCSIRHISELCQHSLQTQRTPIIQTYTVYLFPYITYNRHNKKEQ